MTDRPYSFSGFAAPAGSGFLFPVLGLRASMLACSSIWESHFVDQPVRKLRVLFSSSVAGHSNLPVNFLFLLDMILYVISLLYGSSDPVVPFKVPARKIF